MSKKAYINQTNRGITNILDVKLPTNNDAITKKKHRENIYIELIFCPIQEYIINHNTKLNVIPV